ncbi:MAG: LysR family transcriptional regulator [Chitinophagales bacterium]|nr:LysR family transcriptional regulator [Chitinophagales bacterium]
MNYTLQQIRIFSEVVRLKSITKTALELHLTQPAVSIQLRNFQQQFEMPLFEVINKRFYVTDFGLEIVSACNKILEDLTLIDSRLAAFHGQLTGKLKLSVVSTGKYIAPYFLSDFLKQNPAVDLWMDVTNKSEVLESLQNNEVDFALVSVVPDDLKVNKVELFPNKLYVVTNTARKITKGQKDKLFLKDLPFIYRELGSGTRYVMENYIKKSRLPIAKKMELRSNEAVKQALLAGLGYSIMPLIGLKNELLNKQLQIVPVKGFPIQSKWVLIWQKDKKLSPVAKAYVDYIQQEKQQIIESKFAWIHKY